MADDVAAIWERFCADPGEHTFEPVYDRTRALAYTICHRILRNPEDALDAFQSAYGRLIAELRADPEFGRRGMSEAVRLLAVREADNLRKRRMRKQRAEIAVEELPIAAAPGASPRAAAMTGQVCDRIERLVDGLPERYRGPLLMHYFHGMSQREIAEATGAPARTISNRIAMGLRALRPQMVQAGLADALKSMTAIVGAAQLIQPPATATAATVFVHAEAVAAGGSALAGGAGFGAQLAWLALMAKTKAALAAAAMLMALLGMSWWSMAGGGASSGAGSPSADGNAAVGAAAPFTGVPGAVPQPPAEPGFIRVAYVDFTRQGTNGGEWFLDIKNGEARGDPTPEGLTIELPGDTLSVAFWGSPPGYLELLDRSLYRVRVTLATDPNAAGAVPVWSVAHDSFFPVSPGNPLGHGNVWGGETFFTPASRGRRDDRGRWVFDTYLAPNAMTTPQWRGEAGDGAASAFSEDHDPYNDFRIYLSAYDDTEPGGRDPMTLCFASIQVDRIALNRLEVDRVLYDTPISNQTHLSHTADQSPGLALIDDARHAAHYELDTVGSDAATLIPAAPPFDLPELYPVVWEPHTLYRVTAWLQAAPGASGADPVDAIYLNADTPGGELLQKSWASAGSKGNFRQAGSPRPPSLAGGPQAWTLFVYMNEAAAGSSAVTRRLRPMVELLNSEGLNGDGTGSDAVEVVGLEVARMRFRTGAGVDPPR